MYRQFSADDYRNHLNLGSGFLVDGFLIYGTFHSYPYDQLKSTLSKLEINYTSKRMEHEFLSPIELISIGNKRYWFVVAYGGALLSEFVHLACLWVSKKNILIGSCGGLKKGMKTNDIIVPEWSYSEDSSSKAYSVDSSNKYYADSTLRKSLIEKLETDHKVIEGPTVTYQAMLGETAEDINSWAEQGFVGVEMEAATIFSISNFFKTRSAAVLRVGDNLIEEETVLDVNYENVKETRRIISQKVFDIAVQELIKN